MGPSFIRNNREHYLLIPLLFSVIWIYAIYVDWWYMTMLSVLFIYVLFIKLNKWMMLIYLCISVCIISLSFILHKYLLIEHLSDLLNLLFRHSFREKLKTYVFNHYDQQTSSFINLIVFNIKSTYSWGIYNQTADLSIVYLVIVSGFHISIIKNIINLIFKKWKYFANTLNIFLIFFYCYLLNFATSIFRVWLMLVISLITKRFITKRFDILALSALITMALGPSCVLNAGFCMSYLCTGVIFYIRNLNTNKLMEIILINTSAVIVSLPFVIMLQHRFSVFVIINSFIFSYIFAFVFVWFLLLFCIPIFAVAHSFLIRFVQLCIDSAYLLNVCINIKNLNCISYTIYFGSFFFLMRGLKLLR